jgi:hypothetical protein
MVSTHSDDSLPALRARGRYMCILVGTQRTSSALKGVLMISSLFLVSFRRLSEGVLELMGRLFLG